MVAHDAERSVGITVYTNNCTGFQATLKHRFDELLLLMPRRTLRHCVRDLHPLSATTGCRFSDFKVNEVNLAGQVVRLTCLTPPEVGNPTLHARSCRTFALTVPLGNTAGRYWCGQSEGFSPR